MRTAMRTATPTDPGTLKQGSSGRGVRPAVHPVSWWLWALGVAVATTRSPGIASTVILIIALVVVVALCHAGSAFSRAFPAYLALAGGVVVIRVAFYVLVGIKSGADVLIPLPRVPLPEWAAGIALLGPITGSGLLAAVSAGLALAALLLCFGAAVALTNPQRTLRSLPASLHLLGTPAVIAMTVAPQLVESWQRVRRAQALRGRVLRGRQAAAATTLPVLQDALERSITLAASMDSRGYARAHRGSSRLVLALLLTALIGAALGTYALLDGAGPRWSTVPQLPVSLLAVPLFVVGGAAAVIASIIASRRVSTTRYRPDAWGLRESVIAACGIAIVTLALAAGALAPGVLAPRNVVGWSITFVVCGIIALLPATIGRPR
ncbi:MAG: energy-coupling factor transporter transmembrane protein EcfT [Microbacteriaceae bacterium]|nr:energy-coupling factor transporter transmembrane protein EcfT [Microbacteriaceae bacterium]